MHVAFLGGLTLGPPDPEQGKRQARPGQVLRAAIERGKALRHKSNLPPRSATKRKKSLLQNTHPERPRSPENLAISRKNRYFLPMSSAKTLFAPTPFSALSDEERARRQDAVEWTLAAQRRQGYTHDPLIEDACQSFVAGQIDLAELGRRLNPAL
ncbi:hypothetical protein JK181_09555 [Gluconobacter kondonii]|nr:hypothetical protein [Gluconobacter kondonii]